MKVVVALLVVTGVACFAPLAPRAPPRIRIPHPPRADAKSGNREGEEEIGKQSKGFYIRPSAAIEKGGGFFVPGLEGARVRVALGGGLLALVVGSAAADGGAPLSVRVSEAVALAATLAILAPYAAPGQGAPAPARRPYRRGAPFVSPDAPDDADFGRAAIRAAVPEVTFLALVDATTGAPLLVDGGAPSPEATPPPPPGIARRAASPAVFDALAGDDACASAFVVPAAAGDRVWILGTDDESVLRDDDRAWVASILGSVG